MGSNFLLDWSGINQAFARRPGRACTSSGSDVSPRWCRTTSSTRRTTASRPFPLASTQRRRPRSAATSPRSTSKATDAQRDAAVKWIDFYYMQKLLDQDRAVADAKTLAASNQPVGAPTLPIFDKATYDADPVVDQGLRQRPARPT